jgi:hypothetical protein
MAGHGGLRRRSATLGVVFAVTIVLLALAGGLAPSLLPGTLVGRDAQSVAAGRVTRRAVLTSAAIIVGLILAWYWAIKTIPWGRPVITLALLFNLVIAFYIPVLVWGVFRGNRPGLWLISIPVLVVMHLWIW